MILTNAIRDTALIFEGGGMRGAFTAGVVTQLLAAGLTCDYVAGISAGTSNLVNYLSRDPERARKSFVEFGDDPNFGSWRTWLKGQGLFNADYIYEQTWLPAGRLPFDFDAFMANPARWRIGAYDATAGETVYWSRDDIATAADLMRRVRASSSIPLMMPPVGIDGRVYVDGALGKGGGIPLTIAQRDGFTRFFVVLTRPRAYVKRPYKWTPLLRAAYRSYPAIADGVARRAAEYNATRDELLALEAAGRACLVFPEDMTITNRTHDVPALRACFDSGVAQARRDLPRWTEFLTG